MTPGAERLLVLSLRLLKVAANDKLNMSSKGLILQRISAARSDALQNLSMPAASAADTTRLELARYLGKLAVAKTRAY